jgi:aspartyl-tRNA synthetase
MELNEVSDHLGSDTKSNILKNAIGEGKSLLGLCIPGGQRVFTAKVTDRLQEFVRGVGAAGVLVCQVNDDGEWTSPIARHVEDTTRNGINAAFKADAGDVLVMAVGPTAEAQALMGKVRLWCADTVEAAGIQIRDPNAFEFLWVDGFPLFERDDDGILRSTHHVFTAPVVEDVKLLASNPEQVRGQHFDLVLNGVELGGGSIRNHDAEVQR